jgi:hypothetical protein
MVIELTEWKLLMHPFDESTAAEAMALLFDVQRSKEKQCK